MEKDGFHPHKNHQSAIHASDIITNPIKIKSLHKKLDMDDYRIHRARLQGTGLGFSTDKQIYGSAIDPEARELLEKKLGRKLRKEELIDYNTGLSYSKFMKYRTIQLKREKS